MKTFIEHKKGTPTFLDYIKEDISSLRRDLEEISVNDKTYNLSDIKDGWDEVITEPTFADENYIKVKIDDEFSVESSSSGDSTEVEVKFSGIIEIESVDIDGIVKDITDYITQGDDDGTDDRWTMEEITSALERVAWSDYIIMNSDDAEAEISNVTYSSGNATIEYKLKDDGYFVTADVKDMWDDFINELGV